jgi:putative radical SAM enzyme (TIGR03279 family)
MAVRIHRVEKRSWAEKLGIQPGETLLTINGQEITDVLDYRFYEANASLLLEIQDAFGRARKLRVKKREYDQLGLEFKTYLMDQQHRCKNKCIFCFIDQMPPGLRDTLYFKDDDSRLSFLFGNYITLTNLTEHEISRIIKMHISPVNVSVHTTNPELRVKMMGNRFAGNALAILKRFADNGIKLNCQLVLCPGLNDGAELKRTLMDLEELFPALSSIAAVPVGVTKFREGLYPLQTYKKENAAAVLKILESFGDHCKQKHGERLAFASDEFYLLAEEDLPEAAYYEEFPQLENGVGMLTLLREEFFDALKDTEPKEYTDTRRVCIATGKAAYPLIRLLADAASLRFPALHIEVREIENHFFGETITVSGLIVGQDLIEQLEGGDWDTVLISKNMLRREGDLFLDDVSLKEAIQTLKVPICPVENDGYALLSAMLGE